MDADTLGFQFAKELATQLITLSTGLLALSTTFAKDIAKYIPPNRARRLKTGWAVHIVSILCGIWSLMALTGTLMPVDGKRSNPMRLEFSARLPAGLQVISFLAGIITLVSVWSGKGAFPTVQGEFQIVSGSNDQVVLALVELKQQRWEVVGFTSRGPDAVVALLKREANPP